MNQKKQHTLLGGLTHQEFLTNYWQQKPLLVRQAFDNTPINISAEELAGIACDTDIPSRLVIENGSEPWESLFGPFNDDTFANLPASHWTLLVNDIERYYPELNKISNQFRFIPDWRLDDLMLSYAPTHGSVGPHVDEYDVFLIQTAGKREWRIDSKASYNQEIRDDCSLSILKHFDANNTWILEPGDMLYLPPNMPHYGIAQDNDCMTLSVGFRAPSQRELIYNWVDSIIDNSIFSQRYSDKERTLQPNSAEISQKDISILSKLITEGLDAKKDTLSIWLGKYLTETKGEPIPELEIHSEDQIKKRLDTIHYRRKNGLRLAYSEDEMTLHFFTDGEYFPLDKKLKKSIVYLCNNNTYNKSLIKKYNKNPSFKKIFNTLQKNGGIN
ncbi:MAG: cupin domain-containing protein [Cocleimonas sp.]|nr:cupin domain-containing protein [Cocleimonas sp.]